MRNTKEIFRENLRKILQRRGMTLTEAAEACGISLSFLNQMLSGKKSYSPETIDKLSEGLNCSIHEFFVTDQERHSHTESSRSDIIIDIQQVLLKLPIDELETLKMTAEGLLEIAQNPALARIRES